MANKVTSVQPSGTNQYLTPSLTFNRFATDFVSPGVVGVSGNTGGISPATGAFAANAQGTPNLSVQIGSGSFPDVLYVSATPSGGTKQTFSVTSDGYETVTIANNATGSTVYSFIYLQLSTTALNNPAATGTDAASYVTSVSTTPYSATSGSKGNSNGALANALLLAVVTVANGASSISNSAITDARTTAGSVVNGNNPYKFLVYRNASYSTGATGQVTVPFDTKVFDTGTNYSLSGLTFTAPVTAFYKFSAAVNFNQAGGYIGNLALLKNGTSYILIAQFETAANDPTTVAGVSPSIPLNAGDTIALQWNSTYSTGTGFNVGSTPISTWFGGELTSLT